MTSMRREEADTRRRAAVAGVLVGVIAVGIASRLGARAANLPAVLGKDFGDALWALMFYLLVLLAWPRARVTAAAALAMAIASAIEFLKLCHAPWLDALRANRFAGFLLGHGFLWRDFVAYAVGVAVGVVGDLWLRRRGVQRPNPAQ
jgi:hypothetical protein